VPYFRQFSRVPLGLDRLRFARSRSCSSFSLRVPLASCALAVYSFSRLILWHWQLHGACHTPHASIFGSLRRHDGFVQPQGMSTSANTGREQLEILEGTPGRDRTCDLSLRRRMLYPLSYWGKWATRWGRRRARNYTAELGMRDSQWAWRFWLRSDPRQQEHDDRQSFRASLPPPNTRSPPTRSSTPSSDVPAATRSNSSLILPKYPRLELCRRAGFSILRLPDRRYVRLVMYSR
jgi:hypothetical protein